MAGLSRLSDRRGVKSRKVVQATRRLGERYREWHDGLISFGEFYASVQGWINHVRFADTRRLREHVLRPSCSEIRNRRCAALGSKRQSRNGGRRNQAKPPAVEPEVRRIPAAEGTARTGRVDKPRTTT